jgi:DNA repair protein RadC
MSDVLRDLPYDERPRERLMMHGASTLSDSELIAILIGSGMRGKNAIQLARELLRDGALQLSHATAPTLAKVAGMGPAKATRVVAALEFARRALNCKVDQPPPLDLHFVAQKLVKTMRKYTQERLGAVFLDTRGRVLTQRNDIYIGTINNAFVSTRDLVRFVMTDNATGLIIYHNHPSGDPTPSQQDREYTTKLWHSMRLIDVKVVDHLIIGSDNYASMNAMGMVPKPPSESVRGCG